MLVGPPRLPGGYTGTNMCSLPSGPGPAIGPFQVFRGSLALSYRDLPLAGVTLNGSCEQSTPAQGVSHAHCLSAPQTPFSEHARSESQDEAAAARPSRRSARRAAERPLTEVVVDNILKDVVVHWEEK